MFGISGTAASLSGGPNVSVRLSTQLPLEVRIIDLGEGLHGGLSTCDRITTGHVRSLPFKALFAGFTHPGVNWAGTMAAGRNSILRLVALTATSELGEVSDGESYALITQEYMNISIKFAYHFATIDALCSKNPSQNYVSLHFSGGAGSIAGRTLRIHLMAEVLGRIGFAVVATGDLLKATLFREDRETTEEKIRLLGILLASCRLMDMILSRQDDVAFFVDRFFSGNYDFLSGRDELVFPQFYLNGGRWKRAEDGGDSVCIQDGSSWGRSLSAGISGMIGRVVGEPYWEFLENIGAYYYFPLAVVRETVLAAGPAEPVFPVSVRMKLAGGGLDRTGGLVFALTNIDTYCVFSLDAQKGRVSLYAFANSRRRLLAGVRKKIESGRWYALRITLSGKSVQCFCDDELVISHTADTPSIGGIGLWTKADSVVWFKDLRIGSGGEQKIVPFD
jgi:pyruvate,water dikinase